MNAKSALCLGLFLKRLGWGVVAVGTLTYEAVYQTTVSGLGQSSAIGIGGDPVKGTEFIDILELFLADEDTQSIIMIGEIGGGAEEDAAQFLIDEAKRGRSKPTVGLSRGGRLRPGELWDTRARLYRVAKAGRTIKSRR